MRICDRVKGGAVVSYSLQQGSRILRHSLFRAYDIENLLFQMKEETSSSTKFGTV